MTQPEAKAARLTKALNFIRNVARADIEGRGPKMHEIAAHIGVSLSQAHAYVKELEKRNLIEITPHVARGIRLVEEKE